MSLKCVNMSFVIQLSTLQYGYFSLFNAFLDIHIRSLGKSFLIQRFSFFQVSLGDQSLNGCMITSSNWNIFRVTGHLWGESTGHRWIPLTKASSAELWCFLLSTPEQTVGQTIGMLVIWDAIALIMTSLWWWRCYIATLDTILASVRVISTKLLQNRQYVDDLRHRDVHVTSFKWNCPTIAHYWVDLCRKRKTLIQSSFTDLKLFWLHIRKTQLNTPWKWVRLANPSHVGPAAAELGHQCAYSLQNNRRHSSWISTYIITVTSQWAQWRLKSPASRLFAQPLVQVQNNAPRNWPLWGEFTSERWCPHTKTRNAKMFPFGDVIISQIKLWMWLLDWNIGISITKVSLKFVPEGPIDNKPALVWIMAWRATDDISLS